MTCRAVVRITGIGTSGEFVVWHLEIFLGDRWFISQSIEVNSIFLARLYSIN